MKIDLVQIHHADYLEDIPFWISLLNGQDPVLEIGCGHGRVALPLLKNGRTLVGVDRDPSALEFLRESLDGFPAALRSRLSLIEADFLDWQFAERFRAVIIPCNTVSTFSERARKALFKKVHSILEEGGLLAASLPNPVQMLDQLAELESDPEPGEPELETIFMHPRSGHPVQVSSRISALPGREPALRWDWIYDQLYPDGEVERSTVSTVHFPLPAEGYLAELSQAGFSSTGLLGDFEGGPYQEDSPYLIFTSQK